MTRKSHPVIVRTVRHGPGLSMAASMAAMAVREPRQGIGFTPGVTTARTGDARCGDTRLVPPAPESTVLTADRAGGRL